MPLAAEFVGTVDLIQGHERVTLGYRPVVKTPPQDNYLSYPGNGCAPPAISNESHSLVANYFPTASWPQSRPQRRASGWHMVRGAARRRRPAGKSYRHTALHLSDQRRPRPQPRALSPPAGETVAEFACPSRTCTDSAAIGFREARRSLALDPVLGRSEAWS